MDSKRLEKVADGIINLLSDLRVSINDMIYIAMYFVIKTNSQPELRYRMIELGEQISWEIENERKNRERNTVQYQM